MSNSLFSQVELSSPASIEIPSLDDLSETGDLQNQSQPVSHFKIPSEVEDYHLVFASSQTFTGNLADDFERFSFPNGLAGANFRCRWLAAQAGLPGGEWRALIAGQNFFTGHLKSPVYDPKGRVLKVNPALGIQMTEWVDEYGRTDQAIQTLWSQRPPLNSKHSETCNQWTKADAKHRAYAINTSSSQLSALCMERHRLMCVN